eukprot:14564315-Heterocapsa_arctica.AAC.1
MLPWPRPRSRRTELQGERLIRSSGRSGGLRSPAPQRRRERTGALKLRPTYWCGSSGRRSATWWAKQFSRQRRHSAWKQSCYAGQSYERPRSASQAAEGRPTSSRRRPTRPML